DPPMLWRTCPAQPIGSVTRKEAALFVYTRCGSRKEKTFSVIALSAEGNLRAFRRSLRDVPRERRKRQYRDGEKFLSASAQHAITGRPTAEGRRNLFHHSQRGAMDRHAGLGRPRSR